MSVPNSIKHAIELDFGEMASKQAADALAFALAKEVAVSPSNPRHTMDHIHLKPLGGTNNVVVELSSSCNAPTPPDGWALCRQLPNRNFLGWERLFEEGNETLVVWQRCAKHLGDDMYRNKGRRW